MNSADVLDSMPASRRSCQRLWRQAMACVLDRSLRVSHVSHEVLVGMEKEQVLVDKLVPRDDTEEVDKPLSVGPDHTNDDVSTPGARVEEGEVD